MPDGLTVQVRLMKIYGYPIDSEQQFELATASIFASPDELRAIAKMLESVAKQIESNDKTGSDHLHFMDCFENYRPGTADLVIAVTWDL